MLVSDILTAVKARVGYVTNSLVVKSYDDLGCTYKWLLRCGSFAKRHELFIATSTTEDAIETRTAIDSVDVEPAK